MKKYFGIENELLTFKKGKFTHFTNSFFKKLKTKDSYSLDNFTIITETGNKYYIDAGEIIEIVTPPIEINRGFSTRVMNSLILGRNHIVKTFPEFQFTGYSIHWNFTRKESYDEIYKTLVIPFHLFGLTPLSTGLNLRNPEERYELLGDSINNNLQINATALLFGAYSLAIEEENFPLRFDKFIFINNKVDFFLKSGRKSFIHLEDGKKISAQTYLKEFYNWLEPFIKKVSTEKEKNNLENFVS